MIMRCPKCGSEEYCKDGFVQCRQRYQCKRCVYRYTVTHKSDVKSQDTRRMAFEMYLEGLGFRAIGRLLRISYGTAYQWIRNWENQVALPKRNEPIEIVELDEMHTYVGRKKTTAGYGRLLSGVEALLLIDMENGLSLLSVGTGQQQQD
jgi:transposase-like protein